MTTFRTARAFACPPSAVFAALRDPARLARWWGPAGFSNRFDVFEFHPGGRWIFTMIGPDGSAYPNESTFEHIETDRCVVIRHACAPLFTLTLSLIPEAGGTRITWTSSFEPKIPGTGWLFQRMMTKVLGDLTAALATHAASLAPR